MNMRLLTGASTLVLAVCLTPMSLSAQDCTVCNTNWTFGNHEVVSSSTALLGTDGDPTHDWSPGECTPHVTGTPGPGDSLHQHEEDTPCTENWEEEDLEWAALLPSLSAMQEDEIAAYFADVPPLVTLNVERRAFQVLSCDGSGRVVSHFPLTDDQIALLAQTAAPAI